MFTPINFHVDYWNQLGWIDRFSKNQFTDRQRQYAAHGGTGRIYTPAFVVDGVDRGPSGREDFLTGSQNSAPGNLVVKKKGSNTFEVTFESKDKFPVDIYFAELANGLTSNVTKGENEGKVLKHNFVVLRLNVIASENQKANMKLADALKDSFKFEGFAVWVTKKGNLIPIQSVGGRL